VTVEDIALTRAYRLSDGSAPTVTVTGINGNNVFRSVKITPWESGQATGSGQPGWVWLELELASGTATQSNELRQWLELYARDPHGPGERITVSVMTRVGLPVQGSPQIVEPLTFEFNFCVPIAWNWSGRFRARCSFTGYQQPSEGPSSLGRWLGDYLVGAGTARDVELEELVGGATRRTLRYRDARIVRYHFGALEATDATFPRLHRDRDPARHRAPALHLTPPAVTQRLRLHQTTSASPSSSKARRR
jgi:hypothetical protein